MQGYLMNVQWSDEDAGYIATCKEFPGLSAFGETEAEATQQAYVALGGFIETCWEYDDKLPDPIRYSSNGKGDHPGSPMKTATCPHCGNQYNEGAAVCYHCKRFISWKTWLKMEWPVFPMYAGFFIVAYLLSCLISGEWIKLW